MSVEDKGERVITSYEYYASRDGSIRSFYNPHPLTPRINNRGYGRVLLRKDGKNKEFLVHRLIAEAFVPNPSKLETVDHIDGDKLNNKSENLQWLTLSDNLRKRVFAKNT